MGRSLLAAAILWVCLSCSLARAVMIPEYQIQAGSSVTVLKDAEVLQRVRKNKDEQNLQRTDSITLYQIHHIAPELRLTGNDEWAILVLLDKERKEQDIISMASFDDAILHREMYRYYHAENGDPVFIPFNKGEVVDMPESVRERILSIISGNTSYRRAIRIASSQSYEIGVEVALAPDELSDFGASEGSVRLASIDKMWGQDMAEFVVRTKRHVEGAPAWREIYIWVLVESGRPVLYLDSEDIVVERDGVTLFHRYYGSFGYSYSDHSISTFAPKVLPAQQPNGKVLGMEFSDGSGQLAFLTQEYGSGMAWLTFWDLAQRKILFTERAIGGVLRMSSNEKAVYVADYDTRALTAWLALGDQYDEFGSVIKPDFSDERDLLAYSLAGVYPVSINGQGELEVWNAGYGKIELADRFEYSRPIALAVADDGRLVTIGEDLEVSVHEFRVSNSSCKGGTSYRDAFCERPDIVFKESGESLRIDNFMLRTRPIGEERKRIEYLEIHPEKPLLVYCTESPQDCGVIDYQSKTSWSPMMTSSLDFYGSDAVIADDGIYDLSGARLDKFDAENSGLMYGHAAISPLHSVSFNVQPNWRDQLSDHNIIVRDTATGEVVDTIERQFYPIISLSAMPGGLVFASGAMSSSNIYALDLSSLKLVKSDFNAPLRDIVMNEEWMYVSAEGADLLVPAGDPASFRVMDFKATDKELIDKGVVYSQGNGIYRYDFSEGHSKELYKFDSTVHEFILLDDRGEKLAARIDHGRISLPHAGKVLELPYSYTPKSLNSLEFSPSTGTFFVAGLAGYAKNFNKNIEVIQEFGLDGKPVMEMSPVWGRAEVILATESGQLWAGMDNGDLVVRDIHSGLVIDTIRKAHNGHFTAMQEMDGKVVTASTSGAIKIWRTDIPAGKFDLAAVSPILHKAYVERDTGKRSPRLVATVSIDKGGEFVINSPDGYYWSTPKALHNASFIEGNRVFDYTQYDHWLNRPDILLARLESGDATGLMLWEKLVQVRQARRPNAPSAIPIGANKPELAISGPGEILSLDDHVELEYSVESGRAKSMRLHVLVNQIPVLGKSGLRLRRARDKVNLELTPGVNKIRAYLTSEDGLQSETRFLTYNHKGSGEKPDLYVLSVGVSDYADDALDLNYAAKDASDMLGVLSSSEAYDEVHTMTLLDGNVTAAAIREAKEFLSEGSARDHVIVFFAGHGFLDEENNYYFGTSDVDASNPAKRGLPYQDINDLLDGIPSRHKLLMLDTCHSGEVTELASSSALPDGVTARGLKMKTSTAPVKTPGISYDLLQNAFVDLRASTGAIIISAAGGQEYALETSSIKNGIFTASVIKALGESAADADGDGSVTTSELREYTYREVSRLTNGQQRPTTRKYNLDVDFAIY